MPSFPATILLAALALPVAALAQPVAPPAQPGAEPGVTLPQFAAKRAHRMLAADTDGDGRVSRAEFLAAHPPRDPAARFAKLDRNGDGYIDQAELAAHASRRFARLDLNHDGIVTPAERVAVRAAHRRAAPPAGEPS